MEVLDIIIGLLLFFEILNGFKRGFLAEAGSIFGLLLGIFAGLAFREPMGHLFSSLCGNSERVSSVVGFFVTFLVVYLLITILAKIFEGFLGIVLLGWVNRMAGAIFCLLKGLLFLSILLNLYEAIDKDRSFVGPKKIESSVLYKPVIKIAPNLFPAFKSIILRPDTKKPDLNDSHKKTL